MPDHVARSRRGPVTVDMLADDLTGLGLAPGATVLVHSSLSSLGYVCGGPVAVVQALGRVLGPDGTLVVPTHSGDLSDPAAWVAPPVPEEWWDPIRRSMPAFDPRLTPTRLMGAVPDCVLRQPGTRRSEHPQVSFAANGRHADAVTAGHCLDHGLGEGSPLARVYDLDGSVLLLGVGHDRNTSLHLAEYRADWPGKAERTVGAPLTVGGVRRWVTFGDVDIDESDFPRIGTAFEGAHPELVRRAEVGHADAVLVPQRPLVDFAAAWMARSRGRASTSR